VAVLAVLILHRGHQPVGWLARRVDQGGQGGAGASESKVAPETESG
jgi:GMP synthase-like glutamine amidotransferase